MRKLVYAINITLDACCDHTKVTADESLHDYHTNLLKSADVLLYGRKTYELMVPFWPDVARNPNEERSMKDFADAFVSVKQIVVVSRTLKSVDSKTTIIRDNLKEEISRLKQQPGKDILVGGVDLPAQLMQLGLIDEYQVVVLPSIIGGGRRLGDGANWQEAMHLKLIDSKTFGSGTVVLRYSNK